MAENDTLVKEKEQEEVLETEEKTEAVAEETTVEKKSNPTEKKNTEEERLLREKQEFEEFRRQKRQAEVQKMLHSIDHTLLKQTATVSDIRRLCAEALQNGFYSVCVQPTYVSTCKDYFKEETKVKIACVVGFPMGENKIKTKIYETKQAVADGADEIDAVVCQSAIKNENYGYIKKEVKKIVKAAKGRPVKAIIETGLLTDKEITAVSRCVCDAGAAYVKTSTGYFGEGAKAETVQLIKNTVKNDCKIKASGGIRTLDKMTVMMEAGADRIGTSAGVAIAEELKKTLLP